jgi:hypothetical protein
MAMQLDRLRSFCCLKWWALFLGTLLSQCLLSFDLHAAEINFSGYAKSYNSWQERIDLPLLQTDTSLQSQNSLRLTLEGFGKTAGVDSVWQLHYEVSPIITSVSSNLSDSTFSASSDAYRLTDLRSTVGAETSKRRIQQNLDRFNLQLNFAAGDLTVGRQAIAFGAARFINPTDVFLPFDVRTYNTEYRTGIDAIRFQKPFGQLGEIDFGLILGPDGKATSSAAFGQVKTNIEGSDVHVTVMRFAEQNLIGLGLQTALWDFGAWFETASVSGAKDYWRVSLGLDYAFTESTLAMVEYHYNGAGTDEVASYLTQTNQIPYTQGGVFLLGENYIIPAISIQLSPLLSAGLQGVFNLDDNSTYLSASLNYNVKEDLYIGFGYYHFRGEKLSLTNAGMPLLNSEYGSNPDNLFVSLSYYF